MTYCSSLRVDATLIANEFLDKYMPKANGDYVKVYLYLIRRGKDEVDISEVAEALELTDGDVRRAIRYWEESSVFQQEQVCGRLQDEPGKKALDKAEAKPSEDTTARTDEAELRNRYRRASGKNIMLRLSEDEEFSQLLFAVQKYMSKILSDSEQQVFAYLYDGLGMNCEVLDYLVDYCVQQGKANIRYIEKVGLDWHRLGIRDVSAAKKRTRSFEKAKEQKEQKAAKKQDSRGQSRGTDYDSIILNKVIGRKHS